MLTQGVGRGKLLNIDVSEEDLWFSAWCAEGLDLALMPIKMSDKHKAELRALGYEARQIEFHRVITQPAKRRPKG